MKILLLGEYSGFYSNLAKGFEKFGHTVSLFNNGHGWMKLSEGRKYPQYSGRIYGRLARKLMLSADRRLFAGFDLVFLINPEFLNQGEDAANNWDWIRKTNKKIIYTVCGQKDSNFHRRLPYARKHVFTSDDGTIDLLSAYRSAPNTALCDQVVDEANGIIATGGSYDFAYHTVDKPRACIPLPVWLENIDAIPMRIQGPVKIFHGKQHRPDCKGTSHILGGIDCLKRAVPTGTFEFRHSGGHALNDYLKILQATDISIDQCKSMGHGMNAVFSLALGKVVCSGNEPEHQAALKLPPSPVINITPDAMQIASVLEDLLQKSKSELEEIGRAGRRYVEEYHAAEIVAQRYLDFAEGLD